MGKTSRGCKTLPRVHLMCCQGVKLILPKDGFKLCQSLNCQNWNLVFCHKFSFWVLSQFKFLSFGAIWVDEFSYYSSCHNFSFFTKWVLSCHNLSFCILPQFELSFVASWVLRFCHNLSFFSLVTVWVFEYFLSHNLGFLTV